MNKCGRRTLTFVCGLLIGIAAVTASQAQPAARQGAACPAEPVASSAGDKDGQFEPRVDLSGNNAGDVAAFIVIGKEAAAGGRPRDAEVAFLMACRVAEKLKGRTASESADAKYQLGRHYANLALHGGPAAASGRTEMLRRAETLYADSVGVYRARHGERHEKTRFAAEGLSGVRQALANAAPSRPAVAVAKPAPARPPVVASPPMATAPRPSPSFDCDKARSVPEKIICSDAELAQLDRELGRLHARAKAAAVDSVAFKRQNDQEWRRRESTCKDRDCLLRWYAQRRSQLVNGTSG